MLVDETREDRAAQKKARLREAAFAIEYSTGPAPGPNGANARRSL